MGKFRCGQDDDNSDCWIASPFGDGRAAGRRSAARAPTGGATIRPMRDRPPPPGVVRWSAAWHAPFFNAAGHRDRQAAVTVSISVGCEIQTISYGWSFRTGRRR